MFCSAFDFHKRIHQNILVSILAGIIFGIGWWIIIDTTCQYPAQSDFNKFHYIIGVIGTIAFILSNSVSNSQIQGRAYGDKGLGKFRARLLLFISFLLLFGSLIASAWVLFGYYMSYKKERLYPGLAIFSQNLSIFISAMILKFGRKEHLQY